MYRIVEELDTFTPLGIRFWDPALDQQIRDGLKVTGRRLASREVVAAVRSYRDIYVFHYLPGLRDVVHSRDGDTGDSPAETHDYVIEVSDARERFNPVAFAVSLPLPYRGLFLVAADGSPDHALHGLHLYSAPTRTAAVSYGMVRSELVDAVSGAPAAHAVVEIQFFDGSGRTGIADDTGRVALILPLPPLMEGFAASPVIAAGRPLNEQAWDLSVAVRYEPTALETLPNTSIPDYSSIFNQDYGAIQTSFSSSPVSPTSPGEELWPEELEFGKALILKTAGASQLMVSPAASSP